MISILERQEREGWGAKVIDRLSHDLKAAFPGMSGFSARNLKYMRKFAGAWPDHQMVQRTVAQLPWRSNLALLDKLDNSKLRLWYAEKVLELGIVDDVLRHPDDKPAIGLLLVKEKDQVVVEYALTGYNKPISVAQWEREITQSLPEELKSSLPTVEEIEAELGKEADDA